MPDISEYRLGSACRIKSSDHLLEKVDPKYPNTDSSDVETLNSEKYTAVYQVFEHITTDKPSPGNDCSNNSFSGMDKFTCCCHEGGNEFLTLNNSNSTSWLRRLFTSSLFNMDMTIQYLFKSDDVAVQMYLADRLFSFPESDVDFYLLQLVSLYEKSPSLAEHLANYFIYRCTKSVSFAINLVWLLDTFNSRPHHNSIRRVSSIMLNRQSSMPTFSYVPTNSLCLTHSTQHSQPININKTVKLKSTTSATTSLQELDCHDGDDDESSTIVPTTPMTTTNSAESGNDRYVYTTQTLRDLLLPIDEITWSNFMSQSIGVNESFNIGSYNTDQHANNISSPSPNLKLSPKLDHNLRHKRTISDVTSLRTYPYADKSRHRVVMDQLNLINNTETNPSATLGVTRTSDAKPWSSSQDSAVCLSTVDVDPSDVGLTVSNNSDPINTSSLNTICPTFDRFSTQLHSTLGQNPLKSSVSMNKIITKEILPHSSQYSHSSVNLQQLNNSSTCVNDSALQIKSMSSLNHTFTTEDDHTNRIESSILPITTTNLTITKTKIINEPKRINVTPTVESFSPSTESSSPFDSGLYMTATNCTHRSSSSSGDAILDGDDDNADHDVRFMSSVNSFHHLRCCPHYHTVSSVMNRALVLRNYLVPRIIPEWDFVDGLLRIARRLVPIHPKEQRTAHLQAELANLNLHLPARVWLPVNKAGHIVLRIPPTAAVCLNSKDKAPFLIYVEILSCDDPSIIPLPCRPVTSCGSKCSTHDRIDAASNSSASLSVYPWNLNSHTGSYENNEISVNTHTSDELSLRSSISNVSLGEELANNNLTGEFSHQDLPVTAEDTTQYLCNEFELNEIVNENRSAGPDAMTVTPASRSKSPTYIGAGEIRNRLKEQCELQPHKSFKCDPEDPSAAVLKEPWHVKCERIRATSPWGNLPGWILTSAIVKVGDDLRQEQLAYQLVTVLKNIWSIEYVPLWLRPLTVVVISSDSGFIEPVPDTVSFHQIKRHAHLSLLDYMHREHGGDNSEEFLTAQRNFLHSCAAYCLVGYLLQVKDRHNGNILLDNEGHVIHIDYGFILSSSPGKNLGFETSPFKLTLEQVDVMGGIGSDLFEYFKFLLLRGLLAARKHMEQICVLVEIAHATCPQLACFARGNGYRTIADLRQRFQLTRTEEQLKQLVDQMVHSSLNSITTKLYDSFQYYTNGIQ
ncbi:hypothetical protein MN116_008547 [Schistosoma mekongi]|uniref:Phosphatidylinositol 4-kinase beta n=1 Tax=Schistosoma mekongi TaxID=38744 RepID=A0AAE1Z5G4_SCHME|nr:hypothetical protein MN116_008547 [Schistosoma mekongi]